MSATCASASAHVPDDVHVVAGGLERGLERALDRPLVVDDEHPCAASAHARTSSLTFMARQHDAHARAAPGSIVDRERARVGLDEAARDREPEARAARAAAAPAVERLEHPLALVELDAGPVVEHGDLDVVVVARRARAARRARPAARTSRRSRSG